MDGRLFIMGDSLLLRFVLRWMVFSSLKNIVYCLNLTPMDGSLFVTGNKTLFRFYSDG